jgi:hypothetical protein
MPFIGFLVGRLALGILAYLMSLLLLVVRVFIPPLA